MRGNVMFNFKKKKEYPRYSYYDSVLNEQGEPVSTKEALGGKTDKVFVRMDSEFLEDYFKDVAKGNSSYVTYLDDIALDYVKGKKPPVSAVSTLLKLYDSASKRPYNEDVASRIGNLLGVPVVYNRAYKCGSVIFNMSIDYMKYDKNMEYGTIYPDYTGPKNFDTLCNWKLNEWKHFLSKSTMHDPNTGVPISQAQRGKLIESFIPSYFFRKYILGDTDFGLHNVGIVHNKKQGTYLIGPNYDMERAFYDERSTDLFVDYFKDDLQSAMVTHPKAMEKFMARLQSIERQMLITPWLFKNIESKKYKNHVVKTLYRNIGLMSVTYDQYKAKEKER